MALGPGVPDPPPGMKINPRSTSRHRLCEEVAVRANSVLGGLHHEYFWAPTPYFTAYLRMTGQAAHRMLGDHE
jgi:hypothetical protein